METESQVPINYCLYARKSSESDERQAMSIDSQVKEMSDLAGKEGLIVKEVRIESHSAKNSGTRPVFMKLIEDIGQGEFDGVLTWAPDRLSRNAGDLGKLVDLMDVGKLQQIRTFSQTFTNDPSQKFLLMILCSQAKLENDQKGINVKRGVRAKCEMGWRPGPAPFGYMNVAHGGVKKIVPDPELAPHIKEMFELVGEGEWRGRDIKRMFDENGVRSPNGKPIALSGIYRMLKNTFYYGRFEYPADTGNWYDGSHEPLVSKELFDKIQHKLEVCDKSAWGEKQFDYKNIFTCGGCGRKIAAEEKYRKLKNGKKRRHIYYHCTRTVYANCDQPYISEFDLEKEILRFVTENVSKLELSDELKDDIQQYNEFRTGVLDELHVMHNLDNLDLVSYAKHVIRNGTARSKRNLIYGMSNKLIVLNRQLVI